MFCKHKKRLQNTLLPTPIQLRHQMNELNIFASFCFSIVIVASFFTKCKPFGQKLLVLAVTA